LDQGIPRDAAVLLRTRDYECIHVGEIEMSDATDEAILEIAAEKLAIVVTMDADFHTIIAVSGRSRPSVIRIRMQGLHAPEIAQLIEEVLLDFSPDLLRGALITIKARKITCHRLPIGQPD
jgi:predicted nuclease of predicted toxin-antitoxin system